MKLRDTDVFKIVMVVAVLSIVTGCGEPSAQRRYHEVFVDTPKSQFSSRKNPHDFLQMMPDDDIHAQFRNNPQNPEGPMPGDETHSKTRPGTQGQQDMLMNSVAAVPIRWTVPPGWTEQKGSGMRVATFSSADKNSSVETTIVSLAGPAGGVAANIVRWMQQLKIPAPSDNDLMEFIASSEKVQTASGLSLVLFDFTRLQNDAGPEAPGMFAAIVEGQETQIFIKMTGSKHSVIANREQFKALIHSLKVETAL